MPKNISIPLYNVVSDLSDANTEEPTTYQSAASYVAVLDSVGIPARIEFAYSVKPDEFLERGE